MRSLQAAHPSREERPSPSAACLVILFPRTFCYRAQKDSVKNEEAGMKTY